MLSMNIHFDNQRIITTIVHIGRFDERIKTREMKVHEKRNDISLLLSLLLLLVIVHCNEASYDCNVGCDLDPVVNGDTVCGDDGAIYPNECFAICQVRLFLLLLFSSFVSSTIKQLDISHKTDVRLHYDMMTENV